MLRKLINVVSYCKYFLVKYCKCHYERYDVCFEKSGTWNVCNFAVKCEAVKN